MSDDHGAPVIVQITAPDGIGLRDFVKLQDAGAGENEIRAIQSAPEDARAELIEFFSVGAVQSFAALRVAVAVCAWATARCFPPLKVDTRIIEAVGCKLLPGFPFGASCSLLLRAVWIMREDLRDGLDLGKDSDPANVLLRIGWMPPRGVDWKAIKAFAPGSVAGDDR